MFASRTAYVGGFPEHKDHGLATMLMSAARLNQVLKSTDAGNPPAGLW
jgi:hypothetical protein